MEISLVNVENILKVLADAKRLSIIAALQKGPLSAGEVEQAIRATQPTTSFQLKKLIEANIVTVRQEGARKIYQVRDPQVFDMFHSINSYVSSTDVGVGGKNGGSPKIVVMGLDGSGKTALILSLKGDKNLLTYFSLKPTQGLSTVPSLRATFWELGGQVVYREEYLHDPRQYLEQVDRLIFVIDVQDVARYEEALQYLKQVLTTLTSEKISCDILVFLHKFDPRLDHPEEFTDAKLHERLVGKIAAMMPTQYNCQIYKTSIFTVFRKSLVLRVGR